MVVPVLMSTEIECGCIPLPGVGDRVEWHLLWAADDSGPGSVRVDWSEQRPVPPSRVGDPGGVLLVDGPLSAFWRRTAAEAPTSGVLLAEIHGPLPGPLSATGGRVLAVAVVEQTYQRTWNQDPGGRFGWIREPVHDDFSLRQVDRCPRYFHELDLPVTGDAHDPDLSRAEAGVLVQLELAGDH